MAGLVPREVLEMMRQEAAMSFDIELTWIQQVYDANGDAVTDSYGVKAVRDPQYIMGREVTVHKEMYSGEQIQRFQASQWYLPANLGVRAGDRLYSVGDDPTRYPPVADVSEVPDVVNSVYELATSEWQ